LSRSNWPVMSDASDVNSSSGWQICSTSNMISQMVGH
jgi:hypothetical protein